MNQYYNVLIPTDLVGSIVPEVLHSYQDFAYNVCYSFPKGEKTTVLKCFIRDYGLQH